MCGCGHHLIPSERMHDENAIPPANPSMQPPVRVSTVRCPGCGGAIPEDFVFCPNCGRHVLTACPKCHRAAQTDWTHCAFCGADLLAEPANPAQPHA